MKKRSFFESVMLLSMAVSCIKSDKLPCSMTRIRIDTGAMTTVRSAPPEEHRLNDLNLFFFNEDRILEEKIWLEKRDSGTDLSSCNALLARNREYEIFACGNLGYEVTATDYETISSLRCFMAYPDDYRTGIPMAAHLEHQKADVNDCLTIPLERAMAKISVKIDRSRLSEGVVWRVKNVKLGSCPKSAALFQTNRPVDRKDFFPLGYIVDDDRIYRLNSSGNGTSENIDLYMLENANDEKEKECSPYVELKVEYQSDRYSTPEGSTMTYRFHIQGKGKVCPILGNTWYRFKISPEQDGLGTPGWEFDSGPLITRIQEIYIRKKEIRLSVGQTEKLEVDILPAEAGQDMVVWDTSDPETAQVDGDGNVTATGNGTCIISCSAIGNYDIRSECRVTVGS